MRFSSVMRSEGFSLKLSLHSGHVVGRHPPWVQRFSARNPLIQGSLHPDTNTENVWTQGKLSEVIF